MVEPVIKTLDYTLKIPAKKHALLNKANINEDQLQDGSFQLRVNMTPIQAVYTELHEGHIRPIQGPHGTSPLVLP